MRSRLVAALAAVVTLTGVATAAAVTAPAAHAVQPPPGISDTNAQWYLNEWNGNTDAGQPIKLYSAGASHENWGVQVIPRCNAGGTVTHTCPFPLGSGYNDEYYGKPTVQFYYVGHDTTCVGTDANGATVNRLCNDINTGSGGGMGTVQILYTYQNPYRYDVANLYWTTNTGVIRFMCSDNKANGAGVHLSYYVGTCGGTKIAQWTDWY